MGARRVLAVVQYFHPEKLGGYRRLANLVEDNRKLRFVLPTHRPFPRKTSGSWSNVDFPLIPAQWPNRGQFFGWIRYTAVYAKRIMTAEPPLSAVYVSAPPAWWALPAAIVSRIAGVPCIADIGDPASSQGFGIHARWKTVAERLLLKLCAAVVVTSPDIRVSGKPEPILTGVGPEFFAIGKERLGCGAFRPKGKLRVVYYGSMSDLQGLDDLLRSWAEMPELRSRVTLRLVGRGAWGEEKRLAALAAELSISNDVEFRAMVDPDKVPEELRYADWGLVMLNARRPLDYAVPTKLLEYFAAGVPVIAIGGERSRLMLAESGGGHWFDLAGCPRAEFESSMLRMVGGPRFAMARQAHDFARRHLNRDDYQARINTIVLNRTAPWSRTISAAVDWLAEVASVSIPGTGREMVAVRHSVAPAHGAEAASWLYPEIAAYTVSLYVTLYRLEGRAEHLRHARNIAEWLAWCRLPDGSLPFVIGAATGAAKGPLYSFDAGIAAHAWAQLFAVDPDPRWREASIAATRWVMGHQRADGSFVAAVAMESGDATPPDAPDCWYGSGGSLHIKMLMALENLLEFVPNDRQALDARSRLVAFARGIATGDGSVPIAANGTRIRGHAHSYAVEGMANTPELAREARRAIGWSSRIVRVHGSMPEWIDGAAYGQPATDASAQTLRMLALAARNNASLTDITRGLARRLRRCQRRDGSFPERLGVWNRGHGGPVWPTIFAASAFLFWERGDLNAATLF